MSFNLNSSNPEFKDRQKRIFDQLQILENNRKSVNSDTNEIQHEANRNVQRKDMKHFRGKESIFKKPQRTAPKNFISRMPDFKKNPHKWTKYSLEDVQDVTEESNKKSAMDFLKELANRGKSKQGITEPMDELPSRIVFNKHVKGTEKSLQGIILPADSSEKDSLDSKASFSNSKLIMPEYNIGDKPEKKTKMVKKSKPEKGRELKLEHLVFEDEY